MVLPDANALYGSVGAQTSLWIVKGDCTSLVKDVVDTLKTLFADQIASH